MEMPLLVVFTLQHAQSALEEDCLSSISRHILLESCWVAGLFACCRLPVLVFLQVL